MSFLGLFNGPGKAVPNLSSEEFAEGYRNTENSVLLDVRTDMEFDAGHIPDSTLINLMDRDFMSKVEKLGKDRHYYIYCRSGNRSMQAARLMQKQGFEHTYNLAHGVIGWKEKLVTTEQASK